MLHQVLIAVQQWFALAAVGDNRIRLGLELGMGGKSRPARSDYSRLGYRL